MGFFRKRNLAELQKAFARQAGNDLNLRIVKGLPENVTISHGIQIADHDRLYNLYGLLLAGKENCVGEEAKSPEQVTFDFEAKPEPETPVTPDPHVEEEPQEETPKAEKPSRMNQIRRIWRNLEDLFSDDSERDENV